MSYELGSHIDLTYLNRKAGTKVAKKSFQETAQNLIEVGTEYIFKEKKAARRIPVVAL